MEALRGTSGLLSWLEFFEVQGFEEMLEELHRLRGVVMSGATAGASTNGPGHPLGNSPNSQVLLG